MHDVLGSGEVIEAAYMSLIVEHGSHYRLTPPI